MPLGFVKKLAAYLGAKSAGAILPHVSKHPELLGKLVDRLIDRGCQNVREKGEFAPNEMQRKVNGIRTVGEVLKAHLPRLSPNVQRKLVFNLLYLQLTHGEPVRERYHEKYGEWPPTFLAISPSMRCNLKCEGCYAAEYAKFGELTADEFVEVVRQGKDDLGIHFNTIIGGEPTFWPPMWECIERHPDVYFQIYTHGQLIDEELAARVAKLGNAFFAISIEGTEEDTDARRGPGTYGRIMKSMQILRDKGVFFGFSATHTTKNHGAIADADFYQRMLDAGCAFGWVFQYVPIGRDPTMDLVVSPEQRLERFEAIEAFRSTHPIALFDFLNDGEMTDGCMAYGRRYVHVLSSGKVEPCVFVHFVVGDIRKSTMLEIIQSPALRDARSQMPLYGDRRAPCSFLDNPDFIKNLVEKHGLEPGHEGAETLVTNLHQPLVEQSAKYKGLLKTTPKLLERKEAGAE